MTLMMRDQENIEKGIEQGIEQGELKAKKDMAISFAQMGIPVEKIAEAAKVDVKVVQEWLGGKSN